MCEGVGGLMVPLTPGYLVRDLALDMRMPLVVAARPGLGTINHTLLTLEAARAAGLEPLAVVMTPWPSAPSRLEQSNRETVARLGGVPSTPCRSARRRRSPKRPRPCRWRTGFPSYAPG